MALSLRSAPWLKPGANPTFAVKAPARRCRQPDSMSVPKKDIEPDVDLEEDDEPSLPQAEDADASLAGVASGDSLAAGRDAIMRYAKIAPPQPGVYRMIDARGDVLYVGKAKNVKNRIRAYARPAGSTLGSSG